MGHRGRVMRKKSFENLKFGIFTEFYLENFWRPLIKLCLLCSSFVIGWIVLTYYSHYRYISCMRCNFVYRGGIFRTLGVLVCTCLLSDELFLYYTAIFIGPIWCVMRNNFFKMIKFGFFTEFFLEKIWLHLIMTCPGCNLFTIGWIVLILYSHIHWAYMVCQAK